MANELIKQNYKNIANAIRAKTGENAVMTASEMPAKIASIPTGATPSGTISITTNGTHDVTDYANASVNVRQPSGKRPGAITENRTNIDVKWYETVDVNVPSEHTVLYSDAYSGGELFIHDIMSDERPGVCKSRIFSSSSSADYGGDIWINSNYLGLTISSGLSFDAYYVLSDFDNLVDIRLLPGGHVDTNSDDKFITIGTIMNSDVTFQDIAISFNIEYRNYSGSSTEEEVAQGWTDLLYSTVIKDLNGEEIGYIRNVNVTVTLEGSC